MTYRIEIEANGEGIIGSMEYDKREEAIRDCKWLKDLLKGLEDQYHVMLYQIPFSL